MSAHAEFSPSSAYRWVRCPGSIRLAEEAKQIRAAEDEETSLAADEGTFAHEIVERCLLHGTSVKDELGWLMLPELELLQGYVDWVRARPGVLYVEQRVPIIEPYCWGTADAVVVGPVMVIADLKFGRVPVRAMKNAQLLAYAYGAAKRFDQSANRFTLAIFQPRKRNGDQALDVWETDRKTVDRAVVAMKRAIDAALSPRPPIVAGEHCVYCPARGVTCGLHPRQVR